MKMLWLALSGSLVLFGALPSTDNYKLRDYGFGNGGGQSGTSNYSLEGLAGDLGGDFTSSDNYGLRPGLLGSRLASLPDAPNWQNPDDWYNKLQLIINTSGNPDDTTYAVAISSDGFVTTNYVQLDNTVGAALGAEDFRDYAGWGSGSGMNVIGLAPDTTYSVRVKARQGETSETGFGPAASASTSEASISFDIDIASTDTESGSPYNLNFGSVSPGNVTDGPNKIWLDLSSNADSGSYVYVVSENNGLLSATSGHVISSVTGDLGSLGEGIGTRNDTVTESAGGPLQVTSPYDGTSDNIGVIDDQFRQMMSSTGPISDGRASFILKLKTSSMTPAAADYVDVYTVVASAGF